MITLHEQKALSSHEVRQKSPIELAFVGDAVYELLVRETICLEHDVPAGKLHRMSVSYVCAAAQQQALESIGPLLTEEEQDYVRRGRNANKVTSAKNADPADYRAATALECLFGYLYLTGQMERIQTLFQCILENRTESN